VYKLHAVLIHSGSANFGHYYIYIFDRQQQQWFQYNDSSVSRASWEQVKSEAEGGEGSKTGFSFFYLNEDILIGEGAQTPRHGPY